MIKRNVHWILSIILFAVQLLVVLLFINLLVQDLGLFAIIIPVIILALIVGMYLKMKIGLILCFVWSILLFIHSIILVFVAFQPILILYVIFTLVQSYAVSQIRI